MPTAMPIATCARPRFSAIQITGSSASGAYPETEPSLAWRRSATTTKYASGGTMNVHRGRRDQGVRTPATAMSPVSAMASQTRVQSSGCGGMSAVSGARSPTSANGTKRRWIFRSSGFSVVISDPIGGSRASLEVALL